MEIRVRSAGVGVVRKEEEEEVVEKVDMRRWKRRVRSTTRGFDRATRRSECAVPRGYRARRGSKKFFATKNADYGA